MNIVRKNAGLTVIVGGATTVSMRAVNAWAMVQGAKVWVEGPKDTCPRCNRSLRGPVRLRSFTERRNGYVTTGWRC